MKVIKKDNDYIISYLGDYDTSLIIDTFIYSNNITGFYKASLYKNNIINFIYLKLIDNYNNSFNYKLFNLNDRVIYFKYRDCTLFKEYDFYDNGYFYKDSNKINDIYKYLEFGSFYLK